MHRFVTMALIGATLLPLPAEAQSAKAYGPLPSSALDLPSCPDVMLPILQEGIMTSPRVGARQHTEVGEPLLAIYPASILQSRMQVQKEVQFNVDHGDAHYVVTVPPAVLVEADVQSIERLKSTLSYHLANATLQKVGKDGRPGPSTHANAWIYLAEDGKTLKGELKLGSFVQMELANAPITRELCLSAHKHGLRREIVYNGVAKNVVTLQYREFLDDIARPAFSQEATFDLANGREIAFKGMHITVEEASNTGLRYVLSGLPGGS